MHLTQILNSAADTNPSHIASIDGTRTRTWGEMRERVSRLAAAMRALGVGDGDRVAILALNSDRYSEYMYAAWWAGAAVVPMNTRWSAAENAYSLNDSGAETLFVDSNFLPMMDAMRDEVKALKTVIYIDDGDLPEDMLAYEDLIAGNDPCEDVERKDEDLAGLFYTGGTTGFPKGVMVPQRALWYNYFVGAMKFDMNQHSVYLHAAPMFHMADIAGGGGAAMGGGTHIYVPGFDPMGTVEAIAEHGVTHALLVPTMIGMIVQHPDLIRRS